MVKTYLNYINGKWVKSVSGKTLDNVNPATGKLIAKFQAGTKEDVKKAVKAAKAAFPAWRDTPAPKRADILLRTSVILEKRKDEFAKLMTMENGKVLSEARGDVQEAIDMFQYMAGEGRRLFGETTPSELRNKFCMTVRDPIGVVGMITPWNFPMAIPAWKIAPALVCGNTVVFKPASDTPLSAMKLAEVLEDAGLPEGVFNVVTGSGGVVGKAIIEHPDVKHLSFTGSTEVGREVYVGGAKKLNSVELEMGGKNPQIVLADADIDLAVKGAVWGAFGTSGQRCTATSRIIVERPVLRRFTQKFLKEARKIRVGNGLKKGITMGPIINGRQMTKILGYIETGKKEGARLILGGRRLSGKEQRKGFFITPTVFANVKPNMTIAQEEIFGPVTCKMEAKDFMDAVRIANSVDYGLSWSIYTRDINKAMRAMKLAESGLMYINAPTIGAEVHLPFGGVKGTGNGGREAGTTGIEEFSEIKSVFIDYSGGLQRAQIDNK
ncbi:MAG: aldehyde dehydrogenase family protein [Candidatus Aenigmatarchaeota archaeon]|nr:MAG: aldehyde dehydrogenase family protein [Candidatus Aenigmarchaeota archaeon]